MNLYITADRVGVQSGGGVVTANEAAALMDVGLATVVGRHELESAADTLLAGRMKPVGGWQMLDPWVWDNVVHARCDKIIRAVKPGLAHFYAGTFSKTVALLKSLGWKVTYTAAAHSIEESRREHEALGVPYNYHHLTHPEQWKQYLLGYLLADRLIVPSTHSRDVMIGYGADPAKVVIIPHGCDLPPQEKLKPPPQRFTVGYLGAYGPDKGVRYLLEAWKKLNYHPDEAQLILAGRDSNSPFAQALIDVTYADRPDAPLKSLFGIRRLGWVEDITDFYNQISLYVQPSVSEGFGIEILEAMAHGRPVLASTGVGGCDCVPWEMNGNTFGPRDVGGLVERIDRVKKTLRPHERSGDFWRLVAQDFTWDKIRARYVQTWEELTCR